MPAIQGEGAAWFREMSDAQRAFIERNYKYARASIARTVRSRPRAMPAERVDDAALDGLLKAALTYRPGGGASERTYTIYCVRYALMEETQRWRREPRTVSLSGVIDTGPDYSGDSQKAVLHFEEMLHDPRSLDKEIEARELHQAIRELPERMRRIVFGRLAGESNREAGCAVGISETRAFQVYRQALYELAQRLNGWR